MLADLAADTGRDLVDAVEAQLGELARRRRRRIRAVYDLHGDPRAFAVVACVEGFGEAVDHHRGSSLTV